MERFVIIGAGAAGISAAQVLREFRPKDTITGSMRRKLV